MTEATDVIKYREATNSDETDVLAVFEEVASEIPVLLDTLDKQRKIESRIAECCRNGKSLVAVDANGVVVGFVLARIDLDDLKATSLNYIGVSKNSRGRGISANLVKQMKAKGTPLTASVLNGNRSAMADRLVKLGFTKLEPDTKKTKLRWAAPAPAVKAAS